MEARRRGEMSEPVTCACGRHVFGLFPDRLRNFRWYQADYDPLHSPVLGNGFKLVTGGFIQVESKRPVRRLVCSGCGQDLTRPPDGARGADAQGAAGKDGAG